MLLSSYKDRASDWLRAYHGVREGSLARCQGRQVHRQAQALGTRKRTWEGRWYEVRLFRAGYIFAGALPTFSLARYAGGDLTIQDIERILHYMVIESILKEQFEVQQPYGTVIAYMQVRPRHFAQWKRPHSTAAANSSLSLRASTDRTECRASRERPKD